MDNSFKHFFSSLRSRIINIVNLNDHIDTDKATLYIRNNIDIKGPNAYILRHLPSSLLRWPQHQLNTCHNGRAIPRLWAPFGLGYGLREKRHGFSQTGFQQSARHGHHQHSGFRHLFSGIPS